MSNEYQIGVTAANLEGLDALGLYSPLADFSPFSSTKQKGDGIVVGTGLARITWKFNQLTPTELGSLLYFVTTDGELVASKVVYIRTRITAANMVDRVFQTFQALMVLPIEPSQAKYVRNRVYNDVTVTFIQAVAQ